MENQRDDRLSLGYIQNYNEGIVITNNKLRTSDFEYLHIYTNGYVDPDTGERISPVSRTEELFHNKLLTTEDVVFITSLFTDNKEIIKNTERAISAVYALEEEISTLYPCYLIARIDINNKKLSNIEKEEFDRIITEFNRYVRQSKDKKINRLISYNKSFEIGKEKYGDILYKDKLHCHLTLFIDIEDIIKKHVGISKEIVDTLLSNYIKILERYSNDICCSRWYMKPLRYISRESLLLRNLGRHWLSYTCKYTDRDLRYRQRFTGTHLFQNGRVRQPFELLSYGGEDD